MEASTITRSQRECEVLFRITCGVTWHRRADHEASGGPGAARVWTTTRSVAIRTPLYARHCTHATVRQTPDCLCRLGV